MVWEWNAGGARVRRQSKWKQGLQTDHLVRLGENEDVDNRRFITEVSWKKDESDSELDRACLLSSVCKMG